VSAYVRKVALLRPDARVLEGLAEISSILDDVEVGGDHLAQVAKGLRTQARGEDRETVCDVWSVVRFVIRLARPELRGRATIVTDQTPTAVRASRVSLVQVLLNLVVNAGQSMEGQEKPGHIAIRWRAENGFVVVDVTDDGPGIAPEVQAHLFEPLFTTKPVGVGTGLGLSICRELMTEMGGTVQLTSAPGHGTTVRLELQPAT
jgi:two-component system NtrC family sensor kinase